MQGVCGIMEPIKDYSQIDYSQPYEGNIYRSKLSSYGISMTILSVISKIVATILVLLGALMLLITVVTIIVNGLSKNILLFSIVGILSIVISVLLFVVSKKCENATVSAKGVYTKKYRGHDFYRYKCLNYERGMCKDCRWKNSSKCYGGYWNTT